MSTFKYLTNDKNGMLIGLENLKNENFYMKLEENFRKKILIGESDTLPYKNETFAKSINVKFNTKNNQSACIRQWYHGKRCIPMQKLKIIAKYNKANWSEIEKNLIGMKSFGLGFTKFIQPKFPIMDDEKLGSIIGHILGDGWIDTKLSQPAYCNSNKELLKEFTYNANYIFGVEPRIWVQKKKRFEEKSEWMGRIEKIDDMEDGLVATLFYPKSISTILFSIFGKFINNRKKHVPIISRGLSENFKIGLIRAIFDDECSVDYGSQYIRLHQDNPKILTDIKLLLSDIGIRSRPIRKYMKRDKYRHYFGVYGYENFVKFRDKVGFTSSKKINRLNSLIKHLEH